MRREKEEDWQRRRIRQRKRRNRMWGTSKRGGEEKEDVKEDQGRETER